MKRAVLAALVGAVALGGAMAVSANDEAQAAAAVNAALGRLEQDPGNAALRDDLYRAIDAQRAAVIDRMKGDGQDMHALTLGRGVPAVDAVKHRAQVYGRAIVAKEACEALDLSAVEAEWCARLGW